MKQTMKKGIALAIALAMILALAGCALQDAPDPADPAQPAAAADSAAPAVVGSADSEEERGRIAAQVGGYTVTKGDVIDEYNNMLTQYSYYGMAAPTADTDIETLQDAALEGLVGEKVLLYQAEQLGILPLDAEAAAAAEQSYTEELENMLDSYRSYASEQGMGSTDEDIVALINSELEQYGWNMDFEEYKQWMHGQIEQDKVLELLEAKVTETVSATDEDVQAYYDDLVAKQLENYTATPLNYLSAAESYEMDGGDPVLFVPNGYLRVKIIGIQPETEIDTAYDEKLDTMKELEAEYGRLALSGGEADQPRLTAIQTEYAQLKTDTETLYAAHTMQARAKAEEALGKLNGGAAFNDVLMEYGDDETYSQYESFAEKGRLMLPGDEDGWDTELHGAAQALSDGAHSGVIEVDGVFYILQRIGVEQPGTVALEDVRTVIEPLARQSAVDSVWTAKQEEWRADTSVVTYFEDVYRDIGKAS